MDVTPDEGNEMSRSSSASPIPSEAENEIEIEKEDGFGQIQIALDDPGTWPNILTQRRVNAILEAKSFPTIFPGPRQESLADNEACTSLSKPAGYKIAVDFQRLAISDSLSTAISDSNIALNFV
ncbi:hypothetical protein TNCT_123421 [Trichonephila clavata]|uniref:Uncharacterized protein n=1 Tax=Trichonephila clavata TaxID=2740835 RepID=A0A8X6KYJ1_TRICU|nr:hypothetical protein TNCT_123421 [Trichonephila clavata]